MMDDIFECPDCGTPMFEIRKVKTGRGCRRDYECPRCGPDKVTQEELN